MYNVYFSPIFLREKIRMHVTHRYNNLVCNVQENGCVLYMTRYSR